jgi:hypothetical protein
MELKIKRERLGFEKNHQQQRENHQKGGHEMRGKPMLPMMGNDYVHHHQWHQQA